MFRSSNPIFRSDTFARSASGDLMTVRGAVNKTFILAVILVFGASLVWG